MSNASLASIQNTARQMLSALTANAEAVSACGGGENFIQSGQSQLELVQTLDSEQEALKSALLAKTAALEAAISELKLWQSEANNLVKLTYRTQPEKWLEFGIKAKR